MSQDIRTVGGVFQPDAIYQIPSGGGDTGITLVNPSIQAPVVSGQGATATLTAAQSGAIVLFDRAAGITYTLPPPSAGLNFVFIVTVSVTSNNHKVITDATTTFLLGSVYDTVGATGTQFIANGTTHRALTQNGTTTGGLLGSVVAFYCTDSTHWCADGVVLGSGTVATPFATS